MQWYGCTITLHDIWKTHRIPPSTAVIICKWCIVHLSTTHIKFSVYALNSPIPVKHFPYCFLPPSGPSSLNIRQGAVSLASLPVKPWMRVDHCCSPTEAFSLLLLSTPTSSLSLLYQNSSFIFYFFYFSQGIQCTNFINCTTGTLSLAALLLYHKVYTVHVYIWRSVLDTAQLLDFYFLFIFVYLLVYYLFFWVVVEDLGCFAIILR